MNKYKGFTLVELMIVIAIIGILSVVLYPSITGYFERARDTKKKNDVRILQNAFVQRHMDLGIYAIPGTGHAGRGQGWINYVSDNGKMVWTSYNRSILEGLQEEGYIQSGIIDIFGVGTKISKDIEDMKNAPCSAYVKGRDLYMFYTDESRYSISVYLEHATDKDKEYIQTLHNGVSNNGICSLYGKNYGVGN